MLFSIILPFLEVLIHTWIEVIKNEHEEQKGRKTGESEHTQVKNHSLETFETFHQIPTGKKFVPS